MTTHTHVKTQTNAFLKIAIVFCLLFILSGCIPGLASEANETTSASSMQEVDTQENPPILAYYYIWFDPTSWNRAKTDYPTLGHYSSDDRQVIRQHIRWAKAAGINGFIVSWKSSDKLNHRLERMAEIAVQEEFKLALIYQGLDFEREPISTEKIEVDLEYFGETYAKHPAFDIFEKPLVIWSGTWGFSVEEIERTIGDSREHLLILASERNLEGYARLAHLVDGNGYYWSSVNPDTYPNYPGKLVEMGEVIHQNSGLWIAPAAPGFDAREIGGTTVVERANGEMLKRQVAGALATNPDALGIISWNEFSENSHIEPSEVYGTQALEVLSKALGLTADFEIGDSIVQVDRRPPVSFSYGLPWLIALALFILAIFYKAARQARGTEETATQS